MCSFDGSRSRATRKAFEGRRDIRSGSDCCTTSTIRFRASSTTSSLAREDYFVRCKRNGPLNAESVALDVFDGGNPKIQNQRVRRALSIIAGLAFALAGATIASVCIAPIDFALAHGCAPTSHQPPAPYTGRGTCHDEARMAGEAVVPASCERTTFQSSSARATGIIAGGVDRDGAVTALRSASFTRPHDPSHLHAFVLLI